MSAECLLISFWIAITAAVSNAAWIGWDNIRNTKIAMNHIWKWINPKILKIYLSSSNKTIGQKKLSASREERNFVWCCKPGWNLKWEEEVCHCSFILSSKQWESRWVILIAPFDGLKTHYHHRVWRSFESFKYRFFKLAWDFHDL